jgi:hypothetical protein
VTLFSPERSVPIRFFMPALLVGLILAAGAADVVLPVVSGSSFGESEQIEPADSPFGDFCRIRRDGLNDLRKVLVLVHHEDSPLRDGMRTPAPPALRGTPRRRRLATGFEHRSCLRLRSRSPGMDRG